MSSDNINFDFDKHIGLYNKPRPWFRGLIWNFSSGTICSIYLMMSKFVGKTLNTTNVHNVDQFHSSIRDRKGRGLVTVCNHTSRVDDPLLFGMMEWRDVLNLQQMRWGTAAEDVCFKRPFHSFCMAVGRILPLKRGGGVEQKHVTYCVDKLDAGEWIHVFPEGRINMDNSYIRYKWGVGRLIEEPRITPLVLLIHHIGFDQIFPNDKTIYPRIGKKTTVFISDIVDLSQYVQKLKQSEMSKKEIWKEITDKIQRKMEALRKQAEQFHKCKNSDESV